MTEDRENISPDEELFVAYLDEELSADGISTFERRLHDEPEFARSFETYRRTVELVKQVGLTRAPESLLPSVQRRLSRRMARPHGLQVRFPYELLVFMVLLAGILYMYFAMVPQIPGPVAERGKSILVQVHLDQDPPQDLPARYGLEEKGLNERGEALLFGKLTKERAIALMEELSPLAESVPKLSPKEQKVSVALTYRPRPSK